MKKCPFCATENVTEKYFCEKCGSYMGSEHSDGLPPAGTELGKALKKQKKPVEYVHLYHGRSMKKSTYDWLQKKNAGADGLIWGLIWMVVIAGLLSQCS
jgi:hypothetical protein